jgi:hypothetical protein
VFSAFALYHPFYPVILEKVVHLAGVDTLWYGTRKERCFPMCFIYSKEKAERYLYSIFSLVFSDHVFILFVNIILKNSMEVHQKTKNITFI